MRVRLGLVVCALVCLPMPASAEAINRPTWTAGDTWTIKQGADILTFTVLGPSNDSYSVQSKIGANTEIRHLDANLGHPNSHYFRFQWPLETGKQWAYQAIYRGHTHNVTETVLGGESVSVPAGSFEAVHIRGRHCYDPSTCGIFDLWYAPSVKFYAKVTFTGSNYWPNPAPQELVTYQVH